MQKDLVKIKQCLYQIRASNRILKESVYLALTDILKKTANGVGLVED